MTSDRAEVFGGVDTHNRVCVAAAVDGAGRVLGTAEFVAGAEGCGRLAGWAQCWGPVLRVGVEGAGSWGAGRARRLAAADVEAVDAMRPNRQTRRRRGTCDTVGAEAAARAALGGDASVVAESANGCVEATRAVAVARRSAVKARTVAPCGRLEHVRQNFSRRGLVLSVPMAEEGRDLPERLLRSPNCALKSGPLEAR